MDREILFRGKRESDGKWLYGLYSDHFVHGTDFPCIMPLRMEKDDGDWAVLRETVGQYTGLTDKNGTKIFEGDIVRTQPFSDRLYSKKAKFKQHIGIVEYVIRHFKNSLYEQDYEAGWRVKIKDYDKFGYYDWSTFFKCEVIGNIHDNPELLK